MLFYILLIFAFLKNWYKKKTILKNYLEINISLTI